METAAIPLDAESTSARYLLFYVRDATYGGDSVLVILPAMDGIRDAEGWRAHKRQDMSAGRHRWPSQETVA